MTTCSLIPVHMSQFPKANTTSNVVSSLRYLFDNSKPEYLDTYPEILQGVVSKLFTARSCLPTWLVCDSVYQRTAEGWEKETIQRGQRSRDREPPGAQCHSFASWKIIVCAGCTNSASQDTKPKVFLFLKGMLLVFVSGFILCSEEMRLYCCICNAKIWNMWLTKKAACHTFVSV